MLIQMTNLSVSNKPVYLLAHVTDTDNTYTCTAAGM